MAGVQIEFISSKVLNGKDSDHKVKYILDNVRKDKILVLEDTLGPVEQRMLVEKTMGMVSRDFPGIEVSTLGKGENDLKAMLIRLLGGKTSGLTVVGPSRLVREIKRDPNKLHLVAGT
ncbi:MAG: DUF2073 domain-containing protein [Candidatus Micrarchaeota archaeon]|nr:DUF2073 domain-containing protein [Candidatus Micrarchaeota archaeon]